MHELRSGLASHPAVGELVRTTQRRLPPRADGIKPTTLYPTRKAVEALNQVELEQLDRTTERTYVAKDGIEPDNETSPPPTPAPATPPSAPPSLEAALARRARAAYLREVYTKSETGES